MGNLYVDVGKIKDSNDKLPRMEMRTRHIRKSVYRLNEELPSDISDRYDIGQRLEALCRDIDGLANRIEKLYKITDYCAEQYEDTEYENERKARSFY